MNGRTDEQIPVVRQAEGLKSISIRDVENTFSHILHILANPGVNN
jgi:hypothetical protein